MTSNDEAHMRRALELAERAWGRVAPNPLVGAVVIHGDQIVGEGWHEGPGTAHAEVMALRAAGERSIDATVVTTLEPCNRFGRTPPCTRALIEAGVSRVVIGATDPDLGPATPGVSELRAAGVDVEVGLLAKEARALNVAFDHHVMTGRPFVILKVASSLDGKTAAVDGTSRWLTGGSARTDVHRLRAWSDAILVGAGTAIADDPELSVRGTYAGSARPPLRVVVDSAGRVPASLRMFEGSAPTLVATTDRTSESRLRAWGDAGAEVIVLDPDASGHVSLPALVGELGKRDVQGLLVEGGATVAWSAVRDGLVDRLVLYIAPLLIGGAGAPTVLAGDGFAPIEAALRLDVPSVEVLDRDLKVVVDVHGHR
ncbi:MAG: bifunctional diaminohydroxyphosphoribosylaminopyrimidine deaminase/5-amino-6-(5-phosphoribosylamino)uracil reductase RibD [Actinomycetota bacterium]|nr:bifunctional diaminohydroxyphosphoribosylaminopyrimidine deaminase/5-amino-6-(5-phosphoribosylamino)uracil reductase RibD [Actinomycetota bacterium]MDH5223992.1 bifunctional diaminohydroxyphosphoribosylaminopyrimidine deaminase/5-amino-6-(5-phosphoribosylamino)uracil reductase RibD [Actinomycetota bacterium]